ncbi:MAG: hypothetical protein QM582_05510 [Micropruina sp.]|uniref:GNAT family N-acetyltransferase n=1 Tax=Micropruina sp. TaxID=2737536 RepID=UPI0039E2CE2C
MPIPAKSHGCTWHWLSQQDLPEIAGLIAAEEHFGDATHHHDLPALEAAVARGVVRETSTGVVLRKPSGTLIAYAWIRLPDAGEAANRLRLHGGCHPAWRDEGVQETMLRWQIERAEEWQLEQDEPEPVELSMLISGGNLFLAETLSDCGFRPQRWYHAMRRNLADRLPDGRGPLEVGMEPFGAYWSEPVRQLYNETVSHPEDRLEPDAWEWGLASAGIRDYWSWVAVVGGEPVGWVLNAETSLAGELAGWTEYLGARPQWRNRGLYRTLLARSHDSFVEAGLATAGIGIETDSDQGARPYAELGYTSVDSMVWYVHQLGLDTIGAAHTDEQQMGRT